MSQVKTHLFICTNGQPNQIGKCHIKGADELHAEVKKICRELGPSVRINRSGCLGQCELGISAVLYPEGKWLNELTPASATDLIELVKDAHLKNS